MIGLHINLYLLVRMRSCYCFPHCQSYARRAYERKWRKNILMAWNAPCMSQNNRILSPPVAFQTTPDMETHAHLVFLLAALTHDTHGRSPEGVLGRGNIWEEGKRETPSSEVRQGGLTPWEPGSRSPERRKRSLDRQDQNHGRQIFFLARFC